MTTSNSELCPTLAHEYLIYKLQRLKTELRFRRLSLANFVKCSDQFLLRNGQNVLTYQILCKAGKSGFSVPFLCAVHQTSCDRLPDTELPHQILICGH